MVKQQLESRNVIPTVLEFLTTTRAERRVRAKEQEQKERRRGREEASWLDKERLEGEENGEEGKSEIRGKEDDRERWGARGG